MKTHFYLSIAFMLGSCTNAHEIGVHVIDEERKPIDNAEVMISFMRPVNGTSRVFRGVTGSDGRFSARETITIGAFVKVEKTGYYSSIMDNEFAAKNYQVDVVMRRKVAPVPLVVRDLELAIPKNAKKIGVDLEVGDWVAPFGKGAVADFEVEFSNSFSGYRYEGEDWDRIRSAKVNEELSEERLRYVYGRWDAVATIAAPGEMGFVVKETDLNRYCELTMPHEAPDAGYEAKLELQDSTYDEGMMAFDMPPLFLRSRVEVRDGKVVRANYAKIPDGINLDARGGLRFTYYFNPRENDRNLEFDPKQNLAKEQRRGYPP